MRFLNQLINLFWTSLAFSVIIIHWYKNWNSLYFTSSIIISFLIVFFPLHYFQLSSNRNFYERLGVRIAGRLVQDGTLINRLRRHRNSAFRIIKKDNFVKLIRTSLINELYHLICFVFFILTSIHAIITHYYLLAFLTIVSNVVYNLYPIMLQQYIRLRLAGLK